MWSGQRSQLLTIADEKCPHSRPSYLEIRFSYLQFILTTLIRLLYSGAFVNVIDDRVSYALFSLSRLRVNFTNGRIWSRLLYVHWNEINVTCCFSLVLFANVLVLYIFNMQADNTIYIWIYYPTWLGGCCCGFFPLICPIYFYTFPSIFIPYVCIIYVCLYVYVKFRLMRIIMTTNEVMCFLCVFCVCACGVQVFLLSICI